MAHLSMNGQKNKKTKQIMFINACGIHLLMHVVSVYQCMWYPSMVKK